MANKTVYPFGTEGRLPSGIGIVDDLTTGGADKALSAEQGKVIGGKISTYDAVVDDLYGVEREVEESVNFGSETLYKISLDSDYFYYSTSSVTYRAYKIQIPEGVEQVTITPNATYGTYLCISKDEIGTGTTSGSSFASSHMATGCEGYVPTSPSVYRMVIPVGGSVTIKLSKNAKYIYVQKNFNDASINFTPASMVFSGYLRKDGRLDTFSAGSDGVFDGIAFTRGTLDENGVIYPNETHLVSNPIPTAAGYFLFVNAPTYLIESVALFDNSGKCVDRNHWTNIAGLTSKSQSFGSAVAVSGYYVRYVLEKQDGSAASVDDHVVKQFALLNDRRIHRLIPENPKYQYFLERIMALTNTVWKAISKVPAPHAKLPYYYKAGTINFGIPYSDVGEYSTYVGHDVSIRTFLTALLNPRSVMYTENSSSEASHSEYGLVYHNWENAAGAYYGTVCSGLTGYALGLPEILTSALYGTGRISGESVLAKGDQNNPYSVKEGGSWVPCTAEDILELIQPMDLITSPGHVSMISEIYVDEFGNKKFFIWAEETSGATPTAKRLPYNPDRLISRLNGYAATSEGWTLCRYSDWDKVAPVQGDRDNVPMNFFDYPKHLSIDPDICTYKGDYVVFTIGDPADTANNNKAFLNIHRDGDKYDTLQIFAESADESTDTPVATVDISENSGTYIYNSTNIFADDAADKDDWIVVDLKQLPTALTHGKYKARVIKDGGTAASGFTHFQMVDVNFTVTGTAISDLVCNYSSEEGTPFYMRRERQDGLGASSYQRVIPEGETSSTNPRNWAINSTNRYVKVFVRADYGTAVKRIDVYGQFNS